MSQGIEPLDTQDIPGYFTRTFAVSARRPGHSGVGERPAGV